MNNLTKNTIVTLLIADALANYSPDKTKKDPAEIFPSTELFKCL